MSETASTTEGKVYFNNQTTLSVLFSGVNKDTAVCVDKRHFKHQVHR